MTTKPTTTAPAFPLAEIAAAQASRNIFAFDRGADQRQLLRLQEVYATKLVQFEAFYRFFEETTPDIVLRGPQGREVVLRVPQQVVNEVYSTLRDHQDELLRSLEQQIIARHLSLEEEVELAAKHPRTEPDYVPAIMSLCQPAAPLAVRLTPEQSTAHVQAA